MRERDAAHSGTRRLFSASATSEPTTITSLTGGLLRAEAALRLGEEPPDVTATEVLANIDAMASAIQQDARLAAVAISVRFRATWTATCSQLRNLGLIDASERELFTSSPPTAADFIALGERWEAEMEAPAVPPEYGKRVLGAYQTGKLSASRTVGLLWGTVELEDLPEQRPVSLDSLRRDFDPLS